MEEWKQDSRSVSCKIIRSKLNLLFLDSSKTWDYIWMFLKFHAWLYSQKDKSNILFH